jgi:hypothetical protein
VPHSRQFALLIATFCVLRVPAICGSPVFARIALRLLALAAAISLNHQLGRPSHALADYTA